METVGATRNLVPNPCREERRGNSWLRLRINPLLTVTRQKMTVLPRSGDSPNRGYVSRVTSLVKAQHEWRTRCLPLMCSENAMSPTARELLASDFHGRYANSHNDGTFIGNKFIEEVDEIAA